MRKFVILIFIIVVSVSVSCSLLFSPHKKWEKEKVVEQKIREDSIKKKEAEVFIQAMQKRSAENERLKAEQKKINEQKEVQKIAQARAEKKPKSDIKTVESATTKPTTNILRVKDGYKVLGKLKINK